MPFKVDNEAHKLIGLSYDPNAPEQQGIIFEDEANTRTLIDLDETHATEGAR